MSIEDFQGWIENIKNNKPFSVPSGPLAAFDIDDTLVVWDAPEDFDGDFVEIECNGIVSRRGINKHNINLLKKFYESGHVVILWSGSGVRWCNAVAKALDIENYIHGKMSKPSYFIDDKPNPSDWMGKHGYIDINGKGS